LNKELKVSKYRNYDEFVEDLWIPDDNRNIELSRVALGLCEEAGEAAGKLKKHFRKDHNPSYEEDVAKELGDVLFYLTKMAHLHGFYLDEIIEMNVDKLSSRRDRGNIKGSGDNR
jgi:NTP pyrophosphatase (non-canonical NTP hydrolase)